MSKVIPLRLIKVAQRMSNPSQTNTTPVKNRAQLIEVLAQGCKPKEEWRIGTEHEKFGFVRPGYSCAGKKVISAPPYTPREFKLYWRV